MKKCLFCWPQEQKSSRCFKIINYNMPSFALETITTNRSIINSNNNIRSSVADLDHISRTLASLPKLLQSKIMKTAVATSKIINASIQQQQPNIDERNNNIASSALSSSDSLTTATAMQIVTKHNARTDGGSCTSTGGNDVYSSSNTFQSVGIGDGCVSSSYLPVTPTTALEQYRLHLYNYALNIERLRCPQYSAAAAMAAAAAYASSGGGGSGSNTADIAAATAAATSPYVTSSNSHHHRFALSMSLFPPQRIFQPEEPKPQHSYIGLIAMAILSSAETKLVLSDIYQYILDNYPYFRTRGPGWRNSIRHNLSLNDCFIKSGRSANGKGHYWAIHPANIDDFRKGDFRRRKAQRKVRKHMGLAVDDASTDSPSPPPLDLTSASPPPPPHPSQLIAHPSVAAAAAHMHTTHTFGGYLQQHLHPHHTHSVLHPQYHPHPHHHHHAVTPFEQHQLHHYVGQAFGNSSAATAAATAAAAYAAQVASIVPVKNVISQTHPMLQHHQQQRHLQQQQHSASEFNNNSDVNDNNNSSSNNNNQLAIINETRTTTTKTTASVIANLYSQTRKRQFDVASLLAPDVKVVDIIANDNEMTTIEGGGAAVGGGITTTQHTVITKVSVQHQQQQHHHPSLSYHHKQQQALQPLQHNLHTEFDDQQDIDVVANDAEESYKLQTSTNNIALNNDDDDDNMYDADVDAETQPEQETDVNVYHRDNNSFLSSSHRCSLDAATDGLSISRRQSLVSETTTATTEMLSLRPQQQQEADENPTIAAPTTSYEVMCSSSSVCNQQKQQERDSLKTTTPATLHNSHTNSSPSHSSSSSNSTSSPNNQNETNEWQQQRLAMHHEREQQKNTVQRLMHQLQPQQQQLLHHQQHPANNELTNVDPHIFGRYYGTYMAAAARRISGINLAALQTSSASSASSSSSSSAQHQQKHQQ